MNKIYKYKIRLADEQEIIVPEQEIIVPFGAKPLYTNLDGNTEFCIWFSVNTEMSSGPRKVYIRGTGHPIPTDAEYIGTIKELPFFWHVFVGN